MKTITHNIETDKWIDPLTIAHLSNLHFTGYKDTKQMEKIIMTVEGIKPREVVITGNLYDAKNITVWDEATAIKIFLKELAKICPIYLSLGESEVQNLDVNRVKSFLKYGLFVDKILPISGLEKVNYFSNLNSKNQVAFIGQYPDDKIVKKYDHSLVGLNSKLCIGNNAEKEILKEYRAYLLKAAKEINQDRYNILLTSNRGILNYYDKLPELREYDLILSNNSKNFTPQSVNDNPSINKENFIVNEGVNKYTGILKPLNKISSGQIDVINIKRRVKK